MREVMRNYSVLGLKKIKDRLTYSLQILASLKIANMPSNIIRPIQNPQLHPLGQTLH
jgi:hypothetical protein